MTAALRARLARWLMPLLLLAAGGPVAAQDVLPVPALAGRVIDQTGTLSGPDRAALEAKLQAVETERGSQIVVLMVPTTAPEDIAAYAYRVADDWKIGRRDVGDGVLVVVAKNDRRMRIEVARALEGAIPDLIARRIIDQVMKPAFQAGDFTGGLSNAVDHLSSRIAGEGLPLPDATPDTDAQGLQFGDLAVFLFVGAPIIGAVLTGMLGRKLGALGTGGAIGAIGWWFTSSLVIAGAAAVVGLILVLVLGVGAGARPGRGRGYRHGTPIIWGGGGGGFGGGGGGFSSGGGGSFGGGGASGGW